MPSRFDQNGVIRGFLIDYRVTPANNASNTTFTNQLNITVNSTDTLDTVYQRNLTGLIGDESYDVRILAYNTLGLGPHSNIMSIRTQRREYRNKIFTNFLIAFHSFPTWSRPGSVDISWCCRPGCSSSVAGYIVHMDYYSLCQG